ncbi:unnamed protein product [Prorocentrum cordatum]|uniref:Uncharacterized protein n=1 Tax=Prorocentrum cordatum TaxID=2364126 RepID=A0ABN9W8A1_9DINO|nr:unnamed protein product [Polarella glacialis]
MMKIVGGLLPTPQSSRTTPTRTIPALDVDHESWFQKALASGDDALPLHHDHAVPDPPFVLGELEFDGDLGSAHHLDAFGNYATVPVTAYLLFDGMSADQTRARGARAAAARGQSGRHLLFTLGSSSASPGGGIQRLQK